MKSIIVSICILVSMPIGTVQAKPLTAAEIRDQMLGKTIVTRRFGMKITMRYQPNRIVTAKSILGSLKGTWRPKANRICTTFPSGPAKGTSCVSFTKTGAKRYRSSEGVSFSVVN